MLEKWRQFLPMARESIRIDSHKKKFYKEKFRRVREDYKDEELMITAFSPVLESVEMEKEESVEGEVMPL